MNVKKYFVGMIIKSFIALAVIHPCEAAGAGSINISPETGNFKVGQSFNVLLSVDPGSEKIDMARINISYPSDVLEIKSFTPGSTFKYQSGSNFYDNDKGLFTWGAGTPGGVTAVGDFGTIGFGVKKSGVAKISVSQDSLLLSAGQNKFNGQSSSYTYNLIQPKITPIKKIIKSIPVLSQTNINKNDQPTDIVTQPFEDNQVQTQVITSPRKNFAASFTDNFPIKLSVAIRIILSLVVLIIISLIALYKINKTSKIALKAPKKVIK